MGSRFAVETENYRKRKAAYRKEKEETTAGLPNWAVQKVPTQLKKKPDNIQCWTFYLPR